MIAVGEACTERQRGVASFLGTFLDEQKGATKKFR
jgi:hypothetical protein